MGLPSRFLEKKFVKYGKGDDITLFDGTRFSLQIASYAKWMSVGICKETVAAFIVAVKIFGTYLGPHNWAVGPIRNTYPAPIIVL